MGKMVHRELDITGEVPAEVKERVRGMLVGRTIDCSDIPDLSECGAPSPVTFTITLDNTTALHLRSLSRAKHQTPAGVISEWVRQSVAT